MIGMNYLNIIAAVINFTILFAIIIITYRAIEGIKNFINRNKEMDKKIDIILKNVEEKHL